MYYKVKEVAGLVGVSVRTLHHYDQIGILKPDSVTNAGYRLYTDNDLEKLQQILFFKELDFNLQEIKTILENPNFNKVNALKIHKDLLIEKKKRLERIIKSVENTLDSIEGGIEMNRKGMFEAFDVSEIEKYKEKYAEETKKKYGNTKAYEESEKKTSKYTKNDWSKLMTRFDEIYKKIAVLMDRDVSDVEVQAAVVEWRQYITDNFYTCTPEIFRGLGELYVSDERFTANIDKYKPGLANFLQEAIGVYCDNLK